ncbi:UDP-glucuronosyltransferase 2A1-like isoform X3 [Anguilla anguilla]|uniref:UDP-glucuronosyltransferase 2A1-like isoform X3 n=1 Tax=Anguilla anguilla TaxID=7936 RepID=UPI0015AC3046|nr:UDP-glucuronosyltransferase 2A1-like isoform X3 [Anguilla anguilla]
MLCIGKSVPVLVLVLCLAQHTYSGKVLLWPGEYSHWLNMKNIMTALLEKGHQVTVLIHSATPTYTKADPYHFKIFDVPFSAKEVHSISEELIHFWMYEAVNASVLHTALKVMDLMEKMTALQVQMCCDMFRNEELLNKLNQSKYELVLTDPMMPCGYLLSDKLGIPLVISLRISFGYVFERLCGQMPAPPSYVPAPPVQYTDNMTFVERLKNFLLYTLHTTVFNLQCIFKIDKHYSEITGKPTSFCEVIGKADIWLIRTYWDFEYPRPFLPNFKFVGGLHCKPAKPLPEDMEEFVQTSGEDGVVVFSLGSMVKNLTKERRNTIASALGQVPQKVLWRYSGEKPDTLAPNTRVYDWIPQNDLLGHPKTKVFITHGGTNGIYEGIYHGVPMVGIPLFGDQSGNMLHMKTKGAAVILDFNHFQAQDLVDAVNTVVKDPSYKESAMRLSRIHHDQPMKPLDRAVFWIEFVMRNKGAKHLRVQSHNLSWYQYHCLDVLAALLATVVLVTLIIFKSCCFCVRKCCLRSKAKSKKE